MNRLVPLLFLLMALTGCFSVKQLQVSNWTFALPEEGVALAETPSFGEARLAYVVVRSPYDSRNFVVRRKDGSVAFDPCNQFASAPAMLVKGSALDVLRRTGVFRGVQPSVTTADVPDVLELVVDNLSLDCSQPSQRQAVVELTLVRVRNRQVAAAGRGSARVDAASGDYSAAFGKAFSEALRQAVPDVVK